VHTGRSPNDKFLVREPSSQDNVWWGEVNRSIEPDQFRVLRDRLLGSLTGKELYVQDCVAGADPEFSLRVRVVTERAWHSLFARTMFLESSPGAAPVAEEPEFTVIDIPSVEAEPATHGTNSPVFILVDFSERLVLAEPAMRARSRSRSSR
jgi:phosphoenolpyruvate carboxykinase (ATP)